MSALLTFFALPVCQVRLFIPKTLSKTLSVFLFCLYRRVVAGAKEDDYVVDNELNKVIVEESAREADETKEATEAKEQQNPEDPEKFTSLGEGGTTEKSGLGSISFVSCATGEDAIEQPPPTSLVSESEDGKLLFFSFLSVFYPRFILIFLSFFSEAKPRLTKETAVDLGMFLFCVLSVFFAFAD